MTNVLRVQQLPSPHFNQRPAGVVVNLLVLHNISLPPGEFGNGYVEQFFLGKLDATAHPYFDEIAELKVSAHYFITRTGAITEFVNPQLRAWHAGVSSWQGETNCNDFSIGIELEGTDHLPYQSAQYQALAELTVSLMQAYPAITAERIVGHSDIAPKRKTDPGPAFDWDYFRQLLVTQQQG
ncbi:MAG: 1,6-anhydro-N-acetylmuramyl-L-alanine amidase AmpD [Gammaproteobacteria bacterium]|nr:1,6-anhydro-N-acetylmuramyl-L-alanine amidase AmpD [Gammaproteobacteria bacterium]NVK86490.1 1,6-anhydro-N-acetylmuramyl-L-alanine amidase AmpD [Gammaproteobacteria bacterium]